MEAYRESENKVLGMMKEKRTVTERQSEKRKEALERLAKLKQLSFQKGIIADCFLDEKSDLGKIIHFMIFFCKILPFNFP